MILGKGVADMEWKELLLDGYGRIPQELEKILKGLTKADLDWQPHPACNSIGWTVWHLARVQDARIADLAGKEQVYLKDGRHAKFSRPGDPGTRVLVIHPRQWPGSGRRAPGFYWNISEQPQNNPDIISVLSFPPTWTTYWTNPGFSLYRRQVYAWSVFWQMDISIPEKLPVSGVCAGL